VAREGELGQREFVRVPLQVQFDGRMPFGLTVLDGVDVGAACEEQAVAAVERGRQRVVVRGEFTNAGPGAFNGSDVVGSWPGDANQRRVTHIHYILAGTVQPIK